MNLTDLKTLYDFNFWANGRILGVMEKLTDEQYSKDLHSSHGGIRGTFGHLLASHEIWLGRWKGNPTKTTVDEAGGPSIAVAKQFWTTMQQDLSAFLEGLTEADLVKPVSYTNTRGETYSTPLWQMMLQVVNHATYHRGQIVTMLRQLGVKPVNTDIIFYFRQK